MATTNTKKKTPGQTNRYRLDFGRLISKSLIVLVAMAWAFILGVLVGKGYRPENAVPDIAKIMPDIQEAQPQKPKVLKAEELEYYDRLKNAKPEVTPRKAPVPKAPPKVQPRPSRDEKENRPAQQFAYIYQAAAFRSQADALRFQQKLIGLGIPAFIEDTPTGWHRVNVRFKGAPADTAALKQQLKSLGVDKPILRSKQPA
jgi:cell division protein FtsN